MRTLILIVSICAVLPTLAVGAPPATTQPTKAPTSQPATTRDSSAADSGRGRALPSADEVRGLVDAAQYHDAIPLLQKIQSLRSPEADAYNPHETAMLLAECQLQLNRQHAAISTLTMARQAAIKAENIVDADAAGALAILLAKAPGNGYTPRHGSERHPIGVLDRKTRLDAYKALFEDELAVFKQEDWESKADLSIQPILKVANRCADIRALERAGTGATDETQKVCQSMTAWAARLVNAGLKREDDEVTVVEKRANGAVWFRDPAYTKRWLKRRQGLTPDDTRRMQSIVNDCDHVHPVLLELSHAFAEPFPILDTEAEAGRVRLHAASVLTADYSQ